MRERGERLAVRTSGQPSLPRLSPPPGPPSCLGIWQFPPRPRRAKALAGSPRAAPGASYQPPSSPGREERGAPTRRRSPVRRVRSVRPLGPVLVLTRSVDGRAVLPGEGPWGRAPAAGPCLEERSAPGEGEPASALGRAGEMPPPGPRTPPPPSALLASVSAVAS